MHHAIISDSNNDFVIDTCSDSKEASWLCDYLELCSPANILAIAEAFRAMEHRVEAAEANNLLLKHRINEEQARSDAAEAKLAELEKQEPVAYSWRSFKKAQLTRTMPESWKQPRDIKPLFTRPAPATDLAELVPDARPDLPDNYSGDIEYRGMCDGWNACRAAILRNIEESK